MSLANTFAAWGVAPSLAAQVSAILRKYGTDAHVYLPGIGVINGLTAGNYLDSAGTTPATVDNPVGLVVDANGTINATQATTANKPILRLAAGKYSWQFDGTDYLSLGSVPFQMADDHFVIAGGNCSGSNTPLYVLSCPCNGTPVSHRAGQVAYDGTLLKVQASWYDGTNYDDLSYSYSKNTPFVCTALKRGTLVKQRVNGVERNSKTATANPTGTQGFIGKGSANNFEGSGYPQIIGKGTITDSDCLILEKFVGLFSGVTI